MDEFYHYIYIFDANFLKIITPLNFAYYAKYNLEEMIIFPILSIVQGTHALKTSADAMHSLYPTFRSAK